MVVSLPPVLNDEPCFLQGREFFAIQALVSQSSVEAFNVAVLPRTTWLDEARVYFDRGEKFSNTPGDEFGAVVTSDELGNSTDREQVREHFNEVIARELSSNLQCDAFARVFIDDNKHLQRTTVGRSVEDEINRPDVIFVLGFTANDSTI